MQHVAPGQEVAADLGRRDRLGGEVAIGDMEHRGGVYPPWWAGARVPSGDTLRAMSGDAPSLPAPAPARVPRRALRWLVGATVALLAVFHGWLLIRRLVDASIAEPEVLLRWLGACGLLAGAAWLRPRGLSLSQGRPALVFWLLVLVLHVGASPVVVSAVPRRGAAAGAAARPRRGRRRAGRRRAPTAAASAGAARAGARALGPRRPFPSPAAARGLRPTVSLPVRLLGSAPSPEPRAASPAGGRTARPRGVRAGAAPPAPLPVRPRRKTMLRTRFRSMLLFAALLPCAATLAAQAGDAAPPTPPATPPSAATTDTEADPAAPPAEDPSASFFAATTVTALGHEVDTFDITTPVTVIPQDRDRAPAPRQRRRPAARPARRRRQRRRHQPGPAGHPRPARPARALPRGRPAAQQRPPPDRLRRDHRPGRRRRRLLGRGRARPDVGALRQRRRSAASSTW